MLDSEIYGLIVALGILLAMLFFAVLCLFYMKENAKLRRKYPEDEEIRAFIAKERIKVFGCILVELALAAALLLVKQKLF